MQAPPTPFLHQLAERLLGTGGNDLSHICVVLPGRRAGVFFRKALASCAGRPIWAPAVHSVDDFLTGLSGLTVIDRTTLIFKFYEVYASVADSPGSLEEFAGWAETLLADFNEIDLNLLEAQPLFNDLTAVERISRWNPDGSPPTPLQRRHMEFVSQFGGYYAALRDKLMAQREGYQGMVFRAVAEDIPSAMARCPWPKVVFAGFNALTRSEQRIMQAMAEEGRATIYWDMDSYYAADPLHEAGSYLRSYAAQGSILKLGPGWEWEGDHLNSHGRDIRIISVQRQAAQAQAAVHAAMQALEGIPPEDHCRTAIVLSEPHMLLPLLHALPQGLEGVNITMGYSVRHSLCAVLIDKLFRLWGQLAHRSGRFYHLELLAVLRDSFFCALTQGMPPIVVKKAYISPDEIPTGHPIAKMALREMGSSPDAFLQALIRLLDGILASQATSRPLMLELEFAHRIRKVALRLSDLISTHRGFSLRMLHRLWRQLLQGVRLDFKGEPLQGLQVMGMLETRNLDFDHVIIMGVNEGSLPSASPMRSFLTHDIRTAHGLPRQAERDAVMAYHFYRLLQRAKTVTLICDTDTDALGAGEVSRYVRQLRNAPPARTRITELGAEQHIGKAEFRPVISIAKGEAEMARLREQGSRGFSPSALNSFRGCGLRFYFSYVAGFREQEAEVAEMGHDTFGTAVHNALEELYTPSIGHALTEQGLKQMLSQSAEATARHLQKELSSDEALEGRNLLALRVAETYVARVIRNDLDSLREGQGITIIALEQTLTAPVEVMAPDGAEILNIQGKADRIDRTSDGTVRIIDYKTGRKPSKRAITDPEDFDGAGTDHYFQLLMYALMRNHAAPDELVVPAVFYVRHTDMEKPVEVRQEGQALSGLPLVDYARDRVTEVLGRLFDADEPFAQTDDEQRCAHCDFNGICQRGRVE